MSYLLKGIDPATGKEVVVNTATMAALLSVFGASGSSHAVGIVPDPGASAGTTRYLREDGTWDVPADIDAPIPYDLYLQYVGVPQQSEVIVIAPVARAMTLPINLTGSQAVAATAATATTTFTIQKNGSTIGSIGFAAAATVGTFTFTAAVTFAAGDIITIFNPNTADATLATLGVTLVATLV